MIYAMMSPDNPENITLMIVIMNNQTLSLKFTLEISNDKINYGQKQTLHYLKNQKINISIPVLVMY